MKPYQVNYSRTVFGGTRVIHESKVVQAANPKDAVKKFEKEKVYMPYVCIDLEIKSVERVRNS